MVRQYKRKTERAKYGSEKLIQIVNSIKKDIRLADAVRDHGIPETTLRRHVFSSKKLLPVGKRPLFTLEQLNNFKQRFFLAKRGFPLSIEEIRELAYNYAVVLNRCKKLVNQIPRNWYDTKKAGKDWWLGFRANNPDLAVRIAENVSASRAEAFNFERVSSFFDQCRIIFDELDVHFYPQNVYNCDETGLTTVTTTSTKVVTRKGAKNVVRIQAAERGTLTTFLPCVNACGDILPPFLIFKNGSISQDGFLEGSFIASTKSGFIDSDVFLDFLHFFKRHAKSVPEKPLVLFLDGHSAHFSIAAIEYCLEDQIHLICLPPHSSHKLQPLDTHFNGPLKKF